MSKATIIFNGIILETFLLNSEREYPLSSLFIIDQERIDNAIRCKKKKRIRKEEIESSLFVSYFISFGVTNSPMNV